MEKEKGIVNSKTADPGPEFLRSMELLEKMEMLRMMQEFGLDGPEAAQGMDGRAEPKREAPGAAGGKR